MNTKILIWDEISMASKLAFNAVDKLFRDLLNIDEPFGGLIVVLSGDFRQTLPIVRRGTRTSIIVLVKTTTNLKIGCLILGTVNFLTKTKNY